MYEYVAIPIGPCDVRGAVTAGVVVVFAMPCDDDTVVASEAEGGVDVEGGFSPIWQLRPMVLVPAHYFAYQGNKLVQGQLGDRGDRWQSDSPVDGIRGIARGSGSPSRSRWVGG